MRELLTKSNSEEVEFLEAKNVRQPPRLNGCPATIDVVLTSQDEPRIWRIDDYREDGPRSVQEEAEHQDGEEGER